MWAAEATVREDRRPLPEYTDFVLEWVYNPDGRLVVKAACEDLEETSQEVFGLTPEGIRVLAPKIEAAVYGEGTLTRLAEMEGMAPVSQISQKERVDLEELGKKLYRSVFADDDVRDFFAERRADAKSAGKHLRIRIKLDLTQRERISASGDPNKEQRLLARLPWECLHKGDEPGYKFWGANSQFPVVRDVMSSTPVEKARVEDRLRVLLVSANPPGTQNLELKNEEKVIRDTIRGLEGVAEFEVLENATFDRVKDELRGERQYHVLHFMGHGDYDPDQGGVLLLNDPDNPQVADRVGITRWEQELAKQDLMRLLFINACNTASESTSDDGKEPLGGLATSILKAGIPAVIAMQFQVADSAAITFAREFYEDLARFRPLEEAVSNARQEVLEDERKRHRESGKPTNFWLTPVLYVRSGIDSVIFAPDPKSDPGRNGGAEGRHEGRTPGGETHDGPRSRPDAGSGEEGTRGGTPGIAVASTEPVRSDPPAGIDAEADYPLWFTEHDGKLVVNWRINARPRFGDSVALYDEPPEDPMAYLGANREDATLDGRPTRKTRLFLTDQDAEPDVFYIAYIGNLPGGKEILATHGPYRRDATF